MVILQWMIGMTMRTGHIRFRIQVRYDTNHHRRRLKAYHNHLVNHLHLHQPPPCSSSNNGVVTLWRCLWKQELDHFSKYWKIIFEKRTKPIFIHLKRLSCGCSRFPRPLCSFRSSSIFTATIRCAPNALNSTTYSICYARRSSTSQSGSKWSSTAWSKGRSTWPVPADPRAICQSRF